MYVSLHFLEFYTNGIIPFGVWFLSDMNFQIHSWVIVGINFSSFHLFGSFSVFVYYNDRCCEHLSTSLCMHILG